MNVFFRTVLVLIVVFMMSSFNTAQVKAVENNQPLLSYKDFLGKLNKDELAEINAIQMEGGTIYLTDKSGNKFSTFSSDVPGLLPKLIEKNIVLQVKTKPTLTPQQIFFQLVPLFLIFFAWLTFRNIKKYKKKDGKFASKKAIKFQKGEIPVTFSDVAGIPEA
ncbi:MAG TPA: hypothetical protein DD412_00730, partial [Holosporales bacterium]|nr:hypothetical protein [Holosporales bacterium]